MQTISGLKWFISSSIFSMSSFCAIRSNRINSSPVYAIVYVNVPSLLLNWNGFDFTSKCLSSLLKTDYPNFEIIVFDNGSGANEADRLEKKFSKKIRSSVTLRIIRNKRNIGYSRGMNDAFRYA